MLFVVKGEETKTQETTLHMDITRWSIPRTDWLCSLQPKMEKLCTVSKNNTGSWQGSDHELFIAKFRLKLKKVRKTTRPFKPLSSVQFSSVAQSCQTLCNPVNRSTPGLPVHHQFLEFTQTHVHRVGDAIQPSHPLSSPSPPAPYPSQHQGLFQ